MVRRAGTLVAAALVVCAATWAADKKKDPNEIGDRATYEQPFVPPVGISHVCVNGEFVVRDGAATGIRSGRVLRGGGAA